MEKATRLLVVAALFEALAAGSVQAEASDAPSLPGSLAASAAARPLDAIPVEAENVRFVISPPKRGLALPGAAFGAAFGGLLFAIPTLASGGGSEEFQLTLLSAGVGGLAGVAAGAIQPRSRGASDLEPGDEVRLSRQRSIAGTFLGASESGVMVRMANGDERLVPYVDAIEVRRKTRLTGVGAVVGGTIVLTGVLFIHAVLCEGDCSDGPSPVAYAFVGGGAVVGAGIGALVKAHDWRSVTRIPAALSEVSPRRRLSFSVAPTSGKGARGQASFAWR